MGEQRTSSGNRASGNALLAAVSLSAFDTRPELAQPPNKRLVSDRAGRCAPVPAAQPQGVGGVPVLVSRELG
jgi:hypothetical protein